VSEQERLGLIRLVVHFVNGDALGLARALVALGFLPSNCDLPAVTQRLAEELHNTTSSDFKAMAPFTTQYMGAPCHMLQLQPRVSYMWAVMSYTHEWFIRLPS
jgi:predicted unusual protein kinase regulating ubiquinone biosynthesis (AarF/ABC1/UbiB family)